MQKNAIHLRESRSEPTFFNIMPEDSEGTRSEPDWR